MDVSIKKDKLLEVLRTNREKHHALYEEAVQEYKISLEKELKKYLKKVQEQTKGVIRVYISLPVPEEHLDDYDHVIEMILLDTRDVFILSEGEAKTYLGNKWGWMNSFASNTMSYSKSLQF